MTVFDIFKRSVEAIRDHVLIVRESKKDKEFHFQNWFKSRLEELGDPFEVGGRNSYPDFRMVKRTDGYELKGLAYPGRDASFDSNSQAPTGFHNGRQIYYVFGRYPKEPDGDSYPVIDLVICHGDFVNADHDYVHKNRSVKGFGSYGDIMIRDRKMYVVPTPFHLINGAAHRQTLVLPGDVDPGSEFFQVGELIRRETAELIVGYSFDLRTNKIVPDKVPNPGAEREHGFKAWRLHGSPTDPVRLRSVEAIIEELEMGDEESDS
jgi:hypothetical protein